MRLTEWVGEFRASLAEMKRQGRARYFLEMASRTIWAETKLRLGVSVAFRRSVVEAADACEAEDTARGFGSSVGVERFEKCRAAGDRDGMVFWRSVGVYSVLSAMHGTEKIRITEG